MSAGLILKVSGALIVSFLAILLLVEPGVFRRFYSQPSPQPNKVSSEYVKKLEDENRQLHYLVEAQNMLLQKCNQLRSVRYY